MFIKMPSNQRQSLKTEFTSNTNLDSSTTFISFLVETTSKMENYKTIIKLLITQASKLHRDLQIQVIIYGESVSNIFEFGQEQHLLVNSLKEIKFSKTSDIANLGLALMTCYNNIESSRLDDSPSIIFLLSSGISTDESSDGLIELYSLDSNFLYGLSFGDESNLENLSTLLPEFKVIPLSKNPSHDIKALLNNGGDSITKNINNSGVSGSDNIRCPVNIEVYHHSNETQSIRDDLQLDIVIKPDGNQTVIPSGTKIKFSPSKFYSSYTIILEKDLVFGSPYEETITLEYKKGQIEKKLFENFPSRINFSIELGGHKFDGYIVLIISYFLGDFKSNSKCCVGVEGGIGVGKSTLLNGCVNLFNPNNENEIYFNANRISTAHVTTSICNLSLQDIIKSKMGSIHPLQESFHDIDISFSDCWGFIPGDIGLKHKAEGRIHHGTKMSDCVIQPPLECSRIDCFIFVVSARIFVDKDAMSSIDKKIKEVVELGITPLLVITFSDSLSKNDFQEIIRNNSLSVQESNTFIINNYTEKETSKDITKDIQYLRLLTRAVQLCKIKKEKEAIDKLKSLSIYQQQQVESLTPMKISPFTCYDGVGDINNSPFLSSSKYQQYQTQTQTQTQTQSQQQTATAFSNKNNTIKITETPVNVLVDIFNSENIVLTTFEIEAFLDDSVFDLKNKLKEEIDNTMDMNGWSICKETGAVLSESSKLSSINKTSTTTPIEIKLILKKKVKLNL